MLKSKFELRVPRPQEDSDAVRLYELIGDDLRGLRKFLQGKMLTIVDASISDPEQRRALKDLVNEAAWDMYYDRTKMVVYQFVKKHCSDLLKDPEVIRYFVGIEGVPRPEDEDMFPVRN